MIQDHAPRLRKLNGVTAATSSTRRPNSKESHHNLIYDVWRIVASREHALDSDSRTWRRLPHDADLAVFDNHVTGDRATDVEHNDTGSFGTTGGLETSRSART